jgi:hypothetical protein
MSEAPKRTNIGEGHVKKHRAETSRQMGTPGKRYGDRRKVGYVAATLRLLVA